GAGAASTRLAPRGTASAHCYSRLVSVVQLNSPCCGVLLRFITGQVVGSRGVGELPQKIVKDGGAGIPQTASKSARSLATVGLPKASTITIVCPVPSSVAVDGYS